MFKPRSFLLAALLVLAACHPQPVSASPRPAAAALAVVDDTIRVQSPNACVIAEPGVSCRVTVTGSAGATPLNFGPAVTLAPGAALTVSASYTCTTPGQQVAITAQLSAVALNRSGQPSPATISNGTGTLTCRDAIPGQPGQATVTIITITP